jgi:hypothetical protein
MAANMGVPVPFRNRREKFGSGPISDINLKQIEMAGVHIGLIA